MSHGRYPRVEIDGDDDAIVELWITDTPGVTQVGGEILDRATAGAVNDDDRHLMAVGGYQATNGFFKGCIIFDDPGGIGDRAVAGDPFERGAFGGLGGCGGSDDQQCKYECESGPHEAPFMFQE